MYVDNPNLSGSSVKGNLISILDDTIIPILYEFCMNDWMWQML